MVDTTLISEIKDTIKLTQEETDGIEKYRQEKEKKKIYIRMNGWLLKGKMTLNITLNRKPTTHTEKKNDTLQTKSSEPKSVNIIENICLKKINTKLYMKNLWQNKKASCPLISFFYYKLFAK